MKIATATADILANAMFRVETMLFRAESAPNADATYGMVLATLEEAGESLQHDAGACPAGSAWR
jgi:hypothetical protein